MLNTLHLNTEKTDNLDSSRDYTFYVVLKVCVFICCCIAVYFAVFHGNRPYYMSLFEEIATCNIFPFNLYPNIAAFEICIGTLLLSVLFFHDDRFKGIAFSIKYNLTVIGLSLGILLVPMVLLEKFYENPSSFTGLGYAGVHLLLNAATIAGLIFAPIVYLSGIVSCFMAKEIYKDVVEEDENSPEASATDTGTVININDLRRVHCKRRGLAEKADTYSSK